MEKYGCNRMDEINSRIEELKKTNFKTADESSELKDLMKAKQEIIDDEEQNYNQEF